MSIIDNGIPGILKEQFVPCHMMDKSTTNRSTNRSDGQFGMDESYAEGAAIDVMFRKDRSPEVKVAERQGLKEQYTIVVRAGVTLRQNDVIRRDGDGATFRITGRTIDGQAPAASTVPIAKTTAERWDIP